MNPFEVFATLSLFMLLWRIETLIKVQRESNRLLHRSHAHEAFDGAFVELVTRQQEISRCQATIALACERTAERIEQLPMGGPYR